MSCRTSPAGSLATTFVQRRFGLEDSQCTSMFHELRRAHAAGSGPTVTEATYSAALANMRLYVLQSSAWSPAMRARALDRFERARAAGLPAPAIAAALVNMSGRAEEARVALDAQAQLRAMDVSWPVELMQSEFQRLHRSYTRAVAEDAAGANQWVLNGNLAASMAANSSLPHDDATRYVLGVTWFGSRCEQCGQFLGAGSHTCPPAHRRPLLAPRTEPGSEWAPATPPVGVSRPGYPRRAFVDTEVQPVAATATAQLLMERPVEAPVTVDTSPWTRVPVAPWDAEEFQVAYDEARVRIDAGDKTIPAFVNPADGDVTGGLGARVGGNSFGLEIEIDFPDDEYPYTARTEFARRVHAEGIAPSPAVERWHYVGDDRPGGNYRVDADGWICEFDRSVDDQEGQRGVEIKSQILYDEPRTWRNIERICAIARELGGAATPRTGLHVNVGGSGFASNEPTAHNALLRIASAYDDTLLRLAHNPESGPVHRGRQFCGHAPVPPEGFSDVRTAKFYANHYRAFNLSHLPAESQRTSRSSRVEVRVWDSTLDPGRIQAAVTASLAIVKLGLEETPPGQVEELAGAHRQQYGRTRLSGEDWEDSTSSFRRFVSLVSGAAGNVAHHKTALTALFASSRWQG